MTSPPSPSDREAETRAPVTTRAELDTLDLAEVVESLKARIKELERALEPFGTAFDQNSWDGPCLTEADVRAMHEAINIADFRAAHQALSPEGDGR